MENEKQPENKSPEPQNKKPAKQRRAPKAAIIWLVILLTLGGLLLFRDSGSSRKTDLNQTEFEQSLAAGKIVSAVLVNENDNVFTVEGRIKLTGIDSKNSKDGTGFYRSRVIYSEKLNTLLSKTSVKVGSNNVLPRIIGCSVGLIVF